MFFPCVTMKVVNVLQIRVALCQEEKKKSCCVFFIYLPHCLSICYCLSGQYKPLLEKADYLLAIKLFLILVKYNSFEISL